MLAGVAIAGATACFAFDLQGHRGARGLAPEHTLPAFERALEIGVTTLELDVGVTADGVVVGPSACGNLGADHVRFNIETKLNPLRPEETVTPEAMTRALLQVIADAGMARRGASRSRASTGPACTGCGSSRRRSRRST